MSTAYNLEADLLAEPEKNVFYFVRRSLEEWCQFELNPTSYFILDSNNIKSPQISLSNIP